MHLEESNVVLVGELVEVFVSHHFPTRPPHQRQDSEYINLINYTVKKRLRFSRPQPGCHFLTKHSLAGNNLSIPVLEEFGK
jgi:hypothetical protein